MINLFRKNQRGLMLVVAILTIVAFIFLYNTSQLDELAETRNAKIYGQALPQAAIDRQVKNFQLTLALGQYDLVSKLGGTGADQASAMSEFVWNLLVLQHQARALGVEPTDLQVADRIKAVPVFQTDNQFDPLKYSAFVRDQLAPRGFSERQLEEIMRDALRLEKIESIVASPVAVGEKEIRETARVLQPVTAEFVRFDTADAARDIRVAPEEIAGYFERNQSNLNTRETRAVRYVAFELPPGSQLEGRAKVDELQKLADRATKFTDSLANMPFDQAAASSGLTVRSTPAFDRAGTLSSATQSEAETAKQMQEILSKIAPKEVLAALAPPAFLLPAAGKASDVIQSGDAFYVLELSELNPARPLTLAEATPSIEARLRETKAEQALHSTAGEKIKALRAALGSGKKFAEAAGEAGLTVESLNGVAPMGDSLTPEQRRAVSATLSLKEGELSGFETAPGGGICVYLQSRGPLAETELAAKREEIRQSLLDNKRSLLFAEWLRVCREDAKISVPGNPRSR
ncbi:MAG: SurA N-terminal domain-containing protein [Terrimicrobiaceae bacterium]|nr:SurA N-terminal domain-containing protein [Terrimicrobiaceae bacterium]